jgi:hypothetical protein
MYVFQDVVYSIYEYVDLNLWDVLQISPSLTEPEVVHIIREVGTKDNTSNPTSDSSPRFYTGWDSSVYTRSMM